MPYSLYSTFGVFEPSGAFALSDDVLRNFNRDLRHLGGNRAAELAFSIPAFDFVICSAGGFIIYNLYVSGAFIPRSGSLDMS